MLYLRVRLRLALLMQRLRGGSQRHGTKAVSETRDDLRPVKAKSATSRALWLIVSGLLFAAVALSTLTFFHPGSHKKPAPTPPGPSKLPSRLPTTNPSTSPPPAPTQPPGKHAAPPPAAPAPPPVYQPKHAGAVTVEAGDNLWTMAQMRYGNGEDWHRIYDANRSKIQNPNLIYPGEVLVEP
jgi:nucleoid-associated protein YgaU